jgi:presequence protease
VFQELIRKYLVANGHCVAVEMLPDAAMEDRRVAEEEAHFADIKSKMTAAQLAEVVRQAASLRAAQEAVDSPEARATLPTLGLADIDPLPKELPISVQKLSSPLSSAAATGPTVLQHDLETSGILYADVGFDYSGIDEADVELLPLLTRMLMEAGTSQSDLVTLTRKIGTNTGGISVSLNSGVKSAGHRAVEADPSNVWLYLMIRGKAVAGSVPTLFELYTEILVSADLSNQKRAVELLRERKARKESSVLEAGHSLGAVRLGGRSSFLGHLDEVMSGLTSVRAAGRLLREASEDWPAMQTRLERMRSAIIRKNSKAIINLTGNAQLLKDSMASVEKFVASLPAPVEGGEGGEGGNKGLGKTWTKEKLLPAQNEGFTMPSQVNYVVMGGPALQPGAEIKGSYAVASHYLSTGYLWDRVRVQGGAYGGFARFSTTTGRFLYMSYRDPNCAETLEVYDEAAQALSEQEVSSEEVLQAVIGSIGDLDAPLNADQKGFVSFQQYLSGETAEERQRWRAGVLETTGADFKEFARHLARLRETGSIAVFGAQPAIDAANALLPPEKRMVVQQALTSAPTSGDVN